MSTHLRHNYNSSRHNNFVMHTKIVIKYGVLPNIDDRI